MGARGINNVSNPKPDNNPENPTLSKKQLKAIPLILSARNLTEGANSARISRDTVYEWMKDPGFREEYERQSRELVEEGFQSLKGLTSDAVETLRKLLKSRQDAIKYKAATAIIDNTLRYIEAEEIAKRVAELERRINTK